MAGEREAIALLAHAKIEARHIRLFGHVMWELCLDGELVRRDGTRETLAELREGFEAAGTSVREAVEMHRKDRSGAATSPDERRIFDRDLDRICDGLARGPWVAGYASGEGIAERIGGVRVRLGLGALHAEDTRKLARVGDELLDRAVPAVTRILAREPSLP